jgi:hypothetical protein
VLPADLCSEAVVAWDCLNYLADQVLCLSPKPTERERERERERESERERERKRKHAFNGIEQHTQALEFSAR